MAYQIVNMLRNQSNLLKSLLALHGEVLTGFKDNFKKQPPEVLYKKLFLNIWEYS